MLFSLSHTDQRVDATLRHYLVRGTRTGERSRQFDRLVSTSTVRTKPPDTASPEEWELAARLKHEAERTARLDETPGAAARLTASRVLANSPRRSAPDKALLLDPKASLGAGAGGAEEFTVVIRATHRDGDVLGAGDAFRKVCELKRTLESSPGYEQACARVETKNSSGDPSRVDTYCSPAFSALDILGAYRHVGLRGVPLAFVATARAIVGLNDGIESVRRICETETGGGSELCDLRPGLGCDPAGCDGNLTASARACVIGRGLVEVCEWVRSAAPTDGEVAAVAAADVLGARVVDGGCESIDLVAAASVVKFGAVAARWSERSGGSPAMEALASPWTLLADRRFGEAGVRGDPRAETEVTPLAFRLAQKGTPGYAAATLWAKEVAGPIVESWGDGHMTASWRQMWALKLMGREYLWGDLCKK